MSKITELLLAHKAPAPKFTEDEAVKQYYEIRTSLQKNMTVTSEEEASGAEPLIVLIQYEKVKYNADAQTITLLLTDPIEIEDKKVSVLVFKKQSNKRLMDAGVDIISLASKGDKEMTQSLINAIGVFTEISEDLSLKLSAADLKNTIAILPFFFG